MNLEQMLGIDLNDPKQRLASELVRADEELLAELVQLRERANKSQAEVARIMGISQSAVARIESGERDLHQSTLRRYAYAVGAVVKHEVQPFDEIEEQLQVATRAVHGLPRGTEWTSLELVARHPAVRKQ